jgi:antitoxin (DNA-binding transcriptional repressor) of toxin-antitoxin stability system
MIFIDVTEARNNLERLLEEVEQGKTLIITRGAKSAKPARRTNVGLAEKWRTAMRDLRDLKKGAGVASIDDLLRWREEARKASRRRSAPTRWA